MKIWVTNCRKWDGRWTGARNYSGLLYFGFRGIVISFLHNKTSYIDHCKIISKLLTNAEDSWQKHTFPVPLKYLLDHESQADMKVLEKILRILEITFRIIALPFWMILVFVAAQKLWIRQSIFFVRFGGEMITYWKKYQGKRIVDIYMEIEQSIDKENNAV